MQLSKEQKQLVSKLESAVGLHFKNKQLLLTAFTHSSFAHENKIESNERLEFLGDSVMGLIISERLYSDSAVAKEGKLSQMRSNLVSEEPLAELSKNFGFDKLLRLGVGESRTEPSRAMIADLVEAIIGAVYLDQGFRVAKKFVLNLFSNKIGNIETAKQITDSKTYLQENYYKSGIEYKSVQTGEPHEPIFTTQVFVGGKLLGIGVATSKRAAEKLAAKKAIDVLENLKHKPIKKNNRTKKH